MLNTVHSSGKHLMTVIHDILDLSKIESRRLELEVRSESPHRILSEVVSLIRVPFREKSLNLAYNWIGEVPKHVELDGSPVLSMAAQIALTHHEKWNGTGYPFGLSGEQISLERRITAVADVFEALSRIRPYKAAFSPDKCREILLEGRGKHFDPPRLRRFYECFR